MMESEFNWATRHKQIVENSFDMHIPPDITLKFEEDENEIHAHKWMMGMVSPVFNKMFFVADTKDKDAKKLLIKGTTFGAFNILKNAIYGITSMENALKGKSVLEVFSVLDLVTRYQISELHQVVRNHLVSFTLTDDTVLKVAANAMEKSSTFEDEAQQLLLLCAKFLKRKLKNLEAVFKYVADHNDDRDIVYDLLARMNDNNTGPVASTVCANCHQESCLHGYDIENGQFREGLIVTTNNNDWWDDDEKVWGNGIVTEVKDVQVRVKSVKSDVDEFNRYGSLILRKLTRSACSNLSVSSDYEPAETIFRFT